MRVVNVYNFGGPRGAAALGVKVVMRGWSVLGNPFDMKDRSEAERARVIAAYRKWLWVRIQAGDADVLKALRAMKEGDRIGCCCAPKACHADVVIAAARWLRLEDAKRAAQLAERMSRAKCPLKPSDYEPGEPCEECGLRGDDCDCLAMHSMPRREPEVATRLADGSGEYVA